MYEMTSIIYYCCSVIIINYNILMELHARLPSYYNNLFNNKNIFYKSSIKIIDIPFINYYYYRNDYTQ